MERINGELLANMIEAAKINLCNHKEELNALNVFPVPDGDTGTNMSMTFTSAADSAKLHMGTVSQIMDGVSMAALRGARGNSGVILSQLLRGMAKGIKGKEEIEIADMERAFSEGTKTAYSAIMKPTEGTILTVFRLMSEHITAKIEEYTDLAVLFKEAKEAAMEALLQTPEMLPKLKQAGVVDSGGKGVYYIIEGMADYLETGVMPEVCEVQASETVSVAADEDVEESNFTYCTEFIIRNKNKVKNELAKRYSTLGDCVVVVADEDIIKVHVHTDNPGIVISEALKIGDLINIKIDNMRYQNEVLEEQKKAETPKERVPVSFVAIASGEGFNNIYKELGITEIVSGGQSMNPSSEDILNAANRTNADVVYVFPNNKNIILAAQQASELYEGQMIVVPTKNMSDVLPCMICFDESAEPLDNLNAMKEVLQNIKSGQVTYAVRDSVFDDIEIKEGEIMALSGSKIVGKGKDINKVTAAMITSLCDDDIQMITVYAGKDISSEQMEKLQEMCEKKHKNVEFAFYRGDQPVYYYLVSLEK